MEERHLCGKCGYPAVNLTTFRELDSPDKESSSTTCPKCDCPDIVLGGRSRYKESWSIVHGSGLEKKMIDKGACVVWVTSANRNTMGKETEPSGSDGPDVEELKKKNSEVIKVIDESRIQKKLAVLGTKVAYGIRTLQLK